MTRREPVFLGRRIALLAAALIAVLAYGTGGYMAVGFPFVDALYMAALALTTMGFTTTVSFSAVQKLFTVSIALMGVTIFLAILATVSEVVVSADLAQRRRRRRMDKRIDGLKNHYIVCAYGRVGRTVAREFEGDGIPFVVIEARADLEESMRRDGVLHVIGDPADERVLRAAGIARARGLVCAMDSDAANVFIALTARSLNPNLFIVGRAGEATSADRLYRAGADRVVSPYVTSGRHMAMLATRPRLVDYLEMGARDELGMRLEELVVEPGSPLAGRRLGDALGDAAAVVVRRVSGEMVHNPPGDLTLEVGDLLILMGKEAALRPLEGD